MLTRLPPSASYSQQSIKKTKCHQCHHTHTNPQIHKMLQCCHIHPPPRCQRLPDPEASICVIRPGTSGGLPPLASRPIHGTVSAFRSLYCAAVWKPCTEPKRNISSAYLILLSQLFWMSFPATCDNLYDEHTDSAARGAEIRLISHLRNGRRNSGSRKGAG